MPAPRSRGRARGNWPGHSRPARVVSRPRAQIRPRNVVRARAESSGLAALTDGGMATNFLASVARLPRWKSTGGEPRKRRSTGGAVGNIFDRPRLRRSRRDIEDIHLAENGGDRQNTMATLSIHIVDLPRPASLKKTTSSFAASTADILIVSTPVPPAFERHRPPRLRPLRRAAPTDLAAQQDDERTADDDIWHGPRCRGGGWRTIAPRRNLTLNKTNVGAAAAASARKLSKQPRAAARARRATFSKSLSISGPSPCSHASKRPPTKPRRRASDREPWSRRRSPLIKRWLSHERGRRSPGGQRPALSARA